MTDEVQFPRRRPDGSLAVASCFAPAEADGRAAFLAYVREWMRSRDERCGIAVLEDLGHEPRLDEADEGVLRVVFEAQPESRQWKEVLVRFTSDTTEATNASFKGFFDLVAGRYHPASLR